MPTERSFTDFERLETRWADLVTAFGQRVLAETRGEDLRDDPYPRLRRSFASALASVPRSKLDPEEAAGLATIESALVYYDETISTDGHPTAGDGPAENDRLRRSTYDAFAAAADDIRVDGRSIDRLTALARMATASDATERSAIFAAMAPVYAAIDGDGDTASPYRRLVRASAEAWARDGSIIEANAAVLGLAPGALEPMLIAALAAGRTLLESVRGQDPIEPWDYRHAVGEATRRLESAIPLDRLRPINDTHLRALGADIAGLGVTYDIEPREGRPVVPVAFTIGVGIPFRPWVFATYREGGLGNLGELLHESGHAIHYAAIRGRPCFVETGPEHLAFFELVADMLGWDAGEPSFQDHYLGVSVEAPVARLDRYGSVLLDISWALFEIELHRSPERRPNDVWTEITRDGLGIAAHPDISWWAVRGQLVESPGYMANYALSAIGAAAVRARIRSVRGDWSRGDPGWYPFVAERLLRFGGARPASVLLEELLGGPLTVEPLLADLLGTR